MISGRLIRSLPFTFIQTKTNVLGLKKHLKVCDFWTSFPVLSNNKFGLLFDDNPLSKLSLIFIQYVWNKKLNILIIFAAIGNAAATLTDPEKRKSYDLVVLLGELLQQAQRPTHGGHDGYNNTYESEGNYYIKLTINCRHYYFQHQWRTQEIFSGEVSTNSVEDRQNGDLGVVAP